MTNLGTFVEQRLDESTLPEPVERSYRGIIAIAVQIRKRGVEDDWMSWLTGPEFKLGEYLFDADPSSEAERVSSQLLATLASTWDGHPDFDRAWIKLAKGKR